MLSLKNLASFCLLLVAGSAALAQAPAGTLPTVTTPVADFTLPALGAKSIDLSTVFGLPSVTGPVVQFDTVEGNLNVELYPQFAPLTCANFLGYVNSGAYNTTVFNRLIAGFVLQGGTYTLATSGTFSEIVPGPAVVNEFHVSNTRGTLAMAQAGTDPNSATTTWFFNLVDNNGTGLNNLDTLNGGFAVFARVLGTGMTVIDTIATAQVADLSSFLNADFMNTPLINIPSSGNITVVYDNFIRVPGIAPLSIYPTASKPGVLAFAATSSNPAAIAVSVSGSLLAVAAGPSGSASITVTATDTNGNQASTTFNATASPAPVPVAPVFTLQPSSQTVASVAGGASVVLTAGASGTPAPTYQWKFGGAAIPSATSDRLVIPGATAANAGTYTCVATNSAGAATSNPATLSVISTSNAGRLINLSVNTTAGKPQVLTVGFVTGGAGTSGQQNLLIRATGPALAGFGVSGTLADPTLAVYSAQTPVTSNDNWGTPATNQALVTAADNLTGAFALTNPASLDAALVTPLASGAYTVQVSGNTAAAGTALAEIYDDTPANTYAPATPHLINISSNNLIAANSSMTAGFVIGGTTSKAVLIRATGPALAALGVQGTMPDPQLALHTTVNNQDTVLASNAGWGGDQQITAADSATGAFALANPASKDSALLVMLAPGAYTAVASSVTGSAGIALIEVYEVP